MLDPVGPGSVLATAEVVMTAVDDTLREELDAAMRFVEERIRSVATPNERAHIQSDLRSLLSVQLLPSVLAVACHAFRREPGWAEVMNGPVVALVEGLGESPLPADSSFLEAVSKAVHPHHRQALEGSLSEGELGPMAKLTFDATVAELLEREP